jgi:secreted trypsin-like serine protease
MVAGHQGLQRDTCKGDSGGPLYIHTGNDQYALLGVTSRGVRNGFTTCGDGGIYVRLDRCVDWIEQVTGIKLPA